MRRVGLPGVSPVGRVGDVGDGVARPRVARARLRGSAGSYGVYRRVCGFLSVHSNKMEGTKIVIQAKRHT